MIRGGPTFCLMKQLNTPKKDKPISTLQQQLDTRVGQMRELQRFVCIFALMTAYLTSADLARWCFAQQFAKIGRSFQHFARHLLELVTKAEFQGCKLHTVQSASATDICTHPRRQCVGQTTRSQTARVRLKLNGHYRQVKVPEWVRRSPLQEKPSDVACFVPRFRLVPMESRTPAALQGVSRFVRSANACGRCLVSKNLSKATESDVMLVFEVQFVFSRRHLPYVSESIDAGLRPLSEDSRCERFVWKRTCPASPCYWHRPSPKVGRASC